MIAKEQTNAEKRTNPTQLAAFLGKESGNGSAQRLLRRAK